MREFEHVGRSALGHERVVDLLGRDNTTERLNTVGDLLCKVEDIRGHAKGLGAGERTHPTEAGDDLVEDEEDVVRGTDRAELLEVALGRRNHAARACHRLDDQRRDIRGIVERDQLEQIVGELRAGLGHAACERGRLVRERELGVADVIGFDRLAEHLAVRDDATDGDAAEVNAVVALLAADEPGLRALTLRAPVRARHLERRVRGFRARANEEHVIESGRRELLDLVRERERARMTELERGRVVERCDLLLHGLDDLLVAVAEAAAPQAREPVEDLLALGVGVVRALATDDHARAVLELAIAGVRHPVRIEPRRVRSNLLGFRAHKLNVPRRTN